MRSWTKRGRWGVMAMAIACVASAPGRLQGQAAAPAPDVSADPIACWWKTDKDAVLIGEHLTLTVTCGLLENAGSKVAVDRTQFDATALSLTPFEVLGGTTHEEIQSAPWRYFQHDYTLRLLGEGFFGQDVEIPSWKITYGLQSPTGEAEGLDQTLVFPPLPIRILSIVPKNTKSIRDTSSEGFGDGEARLFQARGTFIAAGILFGLAAVLGALAVRKMVGGYRERVQALGHPLPASAVLGGCDRALGVLKADAARDGWSKELAGRALAIFRIAAGVGLHRWVTETVVDRDAEQQTGQLAMRKGILGRQRALLSAPTTADAIGRRLADERGLEPRVRLALEELRESLRTFTAAHYGRTGAVDSAALDAALDQGANALRRLRASSRWPVRKAEALLKSITGAGAPAWPR